MRTFMERFRKLALQIKNLDPNVALLHLIMTLHPGPFADNLCKKPALDLDELRSRVAKFIQLEELHEFRNQGRREHEQRKREDSHSAVQTKGVEISQVHS